MLSDRDILRRKTSTQILDLEDGKLLLRHAGGVRLLAGVSFEALEEVLRQIDGERNVRELCLVIAGKERPRKLRRLLQELLGDLLERVPASFKDEEASGDESTRVLVLGDRTRLAPLADAVPNLCFSTDPAVIEEGDKTFLLHVFEGAPLAEALAVQERALQFRLPSLFVTVEPEGVRVGPTNEPFESPCVACAQLAPFRFLRQASPSLMRRLSRLQSGFVPDSLWPPLLRVLEREVRRWLGGDVPQLLTRSLLLNSTESRFIEVDRLVDCPLCGGGKAKDFQLSRLGCLARQRQAVTATARPRWVRVESSPDLVRSIGILGGGTAGYLTALALRRKHPELEVTIIESSAIPIIGVGEATTPLMPQFLHRELGFRASELKREVDPTFKLGIRFEWGPKGSGIFNYPFGPVRVLESYLSDGDLLRCSPQSILMQRDELPKLSMADDLEVDLGLPLAYHLDNRRFVTWLQQKAHQLGVRRIDARITQVETSQDGQMVRSLVAEDGQRFEFDFFVDASGFKAMLIEKALGSKLVDFATSLPTDRALIFRVPHDGSIKPYTTAQALSSGWCWNTPQREEDHRGYVFSSAFASEQQAFDEIKKRHPRLTDPRMVTFRAGRHEHFWRGNVVAMGNAYGFVEPLESTALHMLIRQIQSFVDSFPLHRGEMGIAAIYNRQWAEFWDYLRWFLALHYKFNHRLDTPFWRFCRHSVDVSSFEELLVAFRERGPLSYQPALEKGFSYPDPLWGAEGIDVILLGQDVPCRLPQPATLDSWHHLERL